MAYTFEQNRRVASVLNRLVKSGCYTAQEALSQRGSMSKLLKRRPKRRKHARVH